MGGGFGDGSGWSGWGRGGCCRLPLSFIECLHFVQLLVNKIGCLSKFSRVPGPDEVVDEHGAWKHCPFSWGTLLIPEYCSPNVCELSMQ